MLRRLRFIYSYWRGRLPWDTNETPPEVIEFVATHAAGRVLDLGCGTGTNVIYLAERGWQATGVDFVPSAITSAIHKAAKAKVTATFYQGDVTHLEKLPLTPPFDYFLDIGCFHTLDEAGQRRYVAQCHQLAASGAVFMLYVGFPRKSSDCGTIGITPEQVAERVAPYFTITHADYGTDTGRGWRRAWYWLKAEK